MIRLYSMTLSLWLTLAVGIPALLAQNSEGPILGPTGAWSVGRADVQAEDASRLLPNSEPSSPPATAATPQ